MILVKWKYCDWRNANS